MLGGNVNNTGFSGRRGRVASEGNVRACRGKPVHIVSSV